LCDFGFSRIRHEVTRTHTNIREGGRLRFLAPELSGGQESFRTTTASDVYSLAMTFFNLSTLCLPLEEHYNEWAAADAARQGQRPQMVDTPRFLAGYFSMLWDLMMMMWEHDQSARPTAATVTQRLQEILRPLIHSTTHDHFTSPPDETSHNLMDLT
jgi:serine/threonine protein kinase